MWEKWARLLLFVHQSARRSSGGGDGGDGGGDGGGGGGGMSGKDPAKPREMERAEDGGAGAMRRRGSKRAQLACGVLPASWRRRQLPAGRGSPDGRVVESDGPALQRSGGSGNAAGARLSTAERQPLGQRAVSLKFLLRYEAFLKAEKKLKGDKLLEISTHDIVHGQGASYPYKTKTPDYSIRGLTKKAGLNMVDFLHSKHGEKMMQKLKKQSVPALEGIKDDGQLGSWFGPTDCFVSHAWELPFHKLVKALQDPRCTGSRDRQEHFDKFFWVDIFAVNQHYLGDEAEQERVQVERKEDLEGFEAVVRDSNIGVLLFMSPWNKPVCLRRAWCWFEIGLALNYNKNIALALTEEDKASLMSVSQNYCKQHLSREEKRGIDELGKLLEGINVENSRCLLSDDLKRIHKRIQQDVGFQQANAQVKLAVAGLLMTTADALLRSHVTTGADKLYEAMLAHFEYAPREKYRSFNKLVRVYTIMGWKEKAEKLCQEAVEAQKQLRNESRDESERKAISLELATNLNSLGRLYCDSKDNMIDAALENLEEALEIRRRYKHELVQEVLYNIGRSIVLHYEEFGDTTDRNRAEDLARACEVLEESKTIQEQSGSKASLGACYVFLGKVNDLLNKPRAEASKYFEAGLKVQRERYRAEDPRVFMTTLDFARHCNLRKQHPKAMDLLKTAQRGLESAVRDFGGDPVKLLECFECRMHTAINHMNGGGADVSQLVREALGFVDWLEANRPHILDSPDTTKVAASVLALAIRHHGSKRDLVVDFIRHKYPKRAKEARAFIAKSGAAKQATMPALLTMDMETMLSAMPTGVADVIVSDAPYNRGLDSSWDVFRHEDFIKRIQDWAKQMVRVLAPDGIGFAFTDAQYVSYWMTALRTARGASPRNEPEVDERLPTVLVETCVWYKPNAEWRQAWMKKVFEEDRPRRGLISNDFAGADQVVRDCAEMVVLFRRSARAGAEFTMIARQQLARDAANVWEASKCVEPERLQGKDWHPAQKPLNLMRAFVEYALAKSESPKVGALVVEPFLGTGSAVAAAAELGVPSIGCDTDATWVDVVRRRCIPQ